ncbi:MAG: hypothetical protein NT175_00090 [Bacteroidetes bacterium]|nr:hypothetical protein [Bacteroidota bacterium]
MPLFFDVLFGSFWVVFVESTDAIFLKDIIRIFLNPKKIGEALMKP